MIVLADTGFHRAEGDPPNVKICRRGQWNVRMTVETTFAMLSVVWGSKEMRHREGDPDPKAGGAVRDGGPRTCAESSRTEQGHPVLDTGPVSRKSLPGSR